MEKIFLLHEQSEECVPQISLDAIAEFKKYDVPTNGVSDASAALQLMLNNANGVVCFPRATYVLNNSLTVDPAKVKYIMGNGAVLKVTGDFPAIHLKGQGGNWSTGGGTIPDKKLKEEAGTIISNLHITSESFDEGTAIVFEDITMCMVSKCHIYNIKDGIEIRGHNTNSVFEGNSIFKIGGNGIVYGEGSNCHQTNIVGNIITNCRTCIRFDNTHQTANVQISGNCIEISSWPTTEQTSTRCIVVDYSETSDPLYSEMEISCNTIQGHELSDGLIDFMSDSPNHPLQNVSLVGNQISNVKSGGYAVKLKNCHNFAISGNTYRRLPSCAVLKLEGTVDCLAVSGETAEMGATYVATDSVAILNYVTLSGLNGKSLTKGINIDCATINGLVINGCNLTGGMTVAASTVDYVSVTGNISRGTNSIASCSHRVVENNI